MTKADLKRFREKLAETLHATRNASTNGAKYVLQAPITGAVVSARTGFLTYDLGEAYGVSEDAHRVFGTAVVHVEEARKVILGILEDELGKIEKALGA